MGAILSAVVTLMIMNLSYGYWRSFEPLGRFDFLSDFMIALQHQLPAWLPVPLPRDCVLGFDVQKWEAQGLYPTFLLGTVFNESRWYYYPVTLLAKLPISLLVLLVATGISLLIIRPARAEWPILLALACVVIGIAGTINCRPALRAHAESNCGCKTPAA